LESIKFFQERIIAEAVAIPRDRFYPIVPPPTFMPPSTFRSYGTLRKAYNWTTEYYTLSPDFWSTKDLIPKGFTLLKDDPKLFYKIEEDGGVLITSADPKRCLINEQLGDGSSIKGGWSPNQGGQLFGERLVPDKMGNFLKRPLRWVNFDSAADTPPPDERRRKPKVKKGTPSTPPRPRFTQEAKNLLQGWRHQEENQRRADMQNNRWHDRFSPTKRSEKKAALSEPHIPPARVIEKLEADLKRADSEYDELRKEFNVLARKFNSTADDNTKLRSLVQQVREQAVTEVEQLTEDYSRRSKIHRWQIEAVPTQHARIEGLEATSWEVEDPSNELRYLVIAHAAPGTEEKVRTQWMHDLEQRVEKDFGDGVYYVLTAPDTAVSVMEIMPGLDQIEEDEDVGQF